MTAVEISGLVVAYRDTVAVDGLDLAVPSGGITAVLGPNGAGKSSLLGVLCTLIAPRAGVVRVFGADPVRSPADVRRHLGVVFQEQTLDRDLSVDRNLRFHARLYGVPRAEVNDRVDAALAAFGLTERRGDRVDQLSGGLARRVEIARALLHRPRMLVLDEPTTGLDPQARRAVWDDLRRLRAEQGVTILFCTHYMDEAEYADRITILRDGRVAGTGTPAELKSALSDSAVLLSTADDETARINLVAAGFDAVPAEDGLVVRTDRPEESVAAIVAAAGVPVRSMAVRHPSLDDVFLTYLGAAG